MNLTIQQKSAVPKQITATETKKNTSRLHSCNRLCPVCSESIPAKNLDTCSLVLECKHAHGTFVHRKCVFVCRECNPGYPISRGQISCNPGQGAVTITHRPALDPTVDFGLGPEDHGQPVLKTPQNAAVSSDLKRCVWCAFRITSPGHPIQCHPTAVDCKQGHEVYIGTQCVYRVLQCPQCVAEVYNHPISWGSNAAT